MEIFDRAKKLPKRDMELSKPNNLTNHPRGYRYPLLEIGAKVNLYSGETAIIQRKLADAKFLVKLENSDTLIDLSVNCIKSLSIEDNEEVKELKKGYHWLSDFTRFAKKCNTEELQQMIITINNLIEEDDLII